jgi:hypothetical protein
MASALPPSFCSAPLAKNRAQMPSSLRSRCWPEGQRQGVHENPANVLKWLAKYLILHGSPFYGSDQAVYRGAFRLAIAAWIRLIVAFEATLHSRTRTTDQPARRSRWETRESRRTFDSIFSLQNLLLLRGRYLHEHPCQKHPSTNTATFRLGHAKSGRPTIGQCFRYPRRPAAQRIRPNANSVVRLPFERTEAMIFERTSKETWSIGDLRVGG